MFCSGADQSKAELRLASFKGALRFWWRSLMWGEIRDVKKLHEREGKLFGSSEYGQSLIRMRFQKLDLKTQVSAGQVFGKGRLPGAHYLGYGVMEAFTEKTGKKAVQLVRPMIPGGIFTVELRFHPCTDKTSIKDVRRALILLGTIGGLGSKSRKGFGSLTLTKLNLDGKDHPLDIDPADRLKELIGTLSEQQPDWSAWSQKARIVKILPDKKTAIELLDGIGREQLHYRSWGRNGKVLDEDREENFKPDHDLFKRQSTSIKYPRRVAFGLPHNYGNGDNNAVIPASQDFDRRASPLFLHIHKLNDDSEPVGLVVFLPARFLPSNKLRVFGQEVSFQADTDFWTPIDGYLDRLKGSQGATKKKTGLLGEEVELV